MKENVATGDNVSVVSYEYDLRGNLIKERSGEDSAGSSTSRDYEYYVSGALRSVAEGDSIIQSNEYDAEGIRISRTENGSNTFYYYGDSGIIYSDGTTDNTYIRGIEGNVDAAYLGGDYSIYATDVQGSTYSLIGESLERDVAYTYSDFGETSVLGDTSNEICYTGAVHDSTTGMYYMNARYYDPDTGRFISQDTYRGEDEDAGTWHLYSYCSNNPINYTDPSGHKRTAKGIGAQVSFTWGKGGNSGGVTVAFIWFNKSVSWASGKRFHCFIGANGEVAASYEKKAKKGLKDVLKAKASNILSKKGLERIRNKVKNLNRILKKVKNPAVTAGFFVITGNSSFTSFKDYTGHYGCASISVRNVNLTFGSGSKNFDVGAAYTTASGFNISWSGGHCMYVGKYTESVSPQAGKNKTKIERKAKG